MSLEIAEQIIRVLRNKLSDMNFDDIHDYVSSKDGYCIDCINSTDECTCGTENFTVDEDESFSVLETIYNMLKKTGKYVIKSDSPIQLNDHECNTMNNIVLFRHKNTVLTKSRFSVAFKETKDDDEESKDNNINDDPFTYEFVYDPRLMCWVDTNDDRVYIYFPTLKSKPLQSENQQQIDEYETKLKECQTKLDDANKQIKHLLDQPNKQSEKTEKKSNKTTKTDEKTEKSSCSAVTKKGVQCKNKPVQNSSHCNKHNN